MYILLAEAPLSSLLDHITSPNAVLQDFDNLLPSTDFSFLVQPRINMNEVLADCVATYNLFSKYSIQKVRD
jgi:hypothetical protein